METTAATVSVLETLSLLNQTASSSYSGGASWLQGQSPQTVGYIAERIQALKLNSASALIPMLDPLTGTWGGYDGYDTNFLDTSLALQALKTANYADSTVLNPALAYLTGSQNSDGGWGFYQGDDSNVYMTAVVSATLQQFPQMSTIATAVNKATAYLLAHQNSDGGFGGSFSTVYETALTYSSLVAVSSNQAALGSALNFLTTSQSANGSWNDDPYSTALALKALYLSENLPSPPPPPPAGGKITGTVIDSATLKKVSGVAVVLASNNLINAVTDATGAFTLNDVPAGSQNVNLTLSGYAPATATATVALNSVANLGTIALVSSYSTGTIAGTISDSTGTPLSGVALTVSGAWSGSATTGAGGSFAFTYVTPGNITLSATKLGYQSFTGEGTVYARTVLNFSPRLSTTASQLTTGTLVGRVVDADWGLPIGHLPEEEGVTITLSGGIKVTPDSRGYFNIPGLAPNTYQATVGMSGFASQTFRMVITPGVTFDLGTIRLAMSFAMTLTGKVTDAATGAPITGAEIAVSGTQLTGRTDFAGNYVMANIDIPEFTLKASAPGYTAKSYIVDKSPWTQTMDISLSPQVINGSLTGTVIDAISAQPLSGVTVTLVGDAATTATTNSAGTFTINAVPRGALQVTVALSGYAQRTVMTAITAGAVNNVGRIGLSVTPLAASIQGAVWDAVANAPFAGVTVQTTGTGTDDLQAVTVADGSYRFDNVTPGMVTVAANAAAKPAYFGARFTGVLEEGGLIIFNPALSTMPPTAFDVTVQTDKAVYRNTEPVGISVNLQNKQSVEFPASLHVRVTDPSGIIVYDTTVNVDMAADGANLQGFSYLLPLSSTAGTYKILADSFDASGMMTGTASNSFGVAVSQISVTPALPAGFSTGSNNVAFNLVNAGDIAVSTGSLSVTLKDPSGQVVFTSAQPFTLGLGESKSLVYAVSLPAFRFGSYTLSYVQSDETKAGQSTDLALPNAVTVAPLFDKPSYRVRETANLTVTINNAGKFNLDPALGSGLTVTVSMPDAGYAETKAFPPALVAGSILGGTSSYSFAVPETMTAGSHKASITITLPSGSTSVQTAQLVVPESALSFSLTQSAYNAGETVRPAMANSGGVDTSVQYKLSLLDAKSTVIAEKSLTETVLAGGTLAISLVIPTGAIDGAYTLVMNYTDLKTLRSDIILKLLAIAGVKATLSVQTDKQTYLSTESIAAQNSLVNTGTALQGGNLHLQVVTAADSQTKKTWTAKSDFQQGVRSGVDTFETPDNVTLLPLSDNFNDGILNTDRWGTGFTVAGFYPSENNGVMQMTFPQGTPTGGYFYQAVGTKQLFAGDFDVSIDYNVLSSYPYDNEGAFFGINMAKTNSYYLEIVVEPTSGNVAMVGSRSSTSSWTFNTNIPLQGKMRVSRSGSTYTSYYWNGTAWVILQRETGLLGNMYISFASQETSSNGKFDVGFDNFTMANNTYTASGTLNLKYDGGRSETWGNLNYTADTPSGTSVKFRTRTADTESALTTSIWSDYLTSNGSAITSPKARWIEVETTLATTNTKVTPVLHDLTVAQTHSAGEILWQTDVPVNLAQGGDSNASNTIPALGFVGKFYFQGTLTSTTGETIAYAEYPFYVEQGNTVLTYGTDKKIYKPGETVTISGVVKNLATVDATNLSMALKAAGSQTLYTESFAVPAGGSHPFTATTTANANGIVPLLATVMQGSVTVAEISDQYVVGSPNVTATLTAPDTAGNDPYAVTVTLNNSGNADAAVNASITDDSGNVIDTQQVAISAGETRLLQYTRQTSGPVTYTAVLSGDLNLTLVKTVGYLAPPTGSVTSSISARIVTDRISYNPNQLATLTVTATAGSATENLSALITVSNSQGQALYSATATIPTLVQGQAVTVNKQWNTGTSPAGTYLVALQITDGAGTVVVRSTCDLVINTPVDPAALLKGSITLDKRTVLTGDPVHVSYSVTNAGNIDLTNVALSILTVNMADPTVYNTITDQATLAIGASHSNSGSIDTQGYSAKDYLVVVRATIAGVEETLAGAYFRVEGAPTAPALIGPVNGSDVETFTPQLSISNAADPNDDKLSYEFEVYSDSSLTELVASETVPETAGNTSWAVPNALPENKTFFWRARAYDGTLYGPWTAAYSFRVNTVDDAPTAPTISTPADGTSVDVFIPALTVGNASDPDSSNLTYNFEVALDPDFTQIVATTKGIAPGQGATSWTVPIDLQENGWYYWRAQADDWLIEGPWAAGRFFVNTTNQAPSKPVITAPADGATVAALVADVVATNSTDPDSPQLTYYFEADTVPTFDSANIIRSGGLAQGEGATHWSLNGLQDNTRYYLRVSANDGSAESGWSDVTTFFANTVNDPPTIPQVANPSNGAGVNVFTPSMSVFNATDPDHDSLSYEFELYADAALTSLVARSGAISEAPQITGWVAPVTLVENQTYYWRSRAFDGALYSDWMQAASFLVNTANDAPGAPKVQAPLDGGSVTTLTPTLAVENAVDPDSGSLTYEFEIYNGATLVAAASGIPGDASGITSWTSDSALSDNTVYQWRARAFDGDSYGPWTQMAAFTVHLPKEGINAVINFDPNTLNRSSKGTWVTVYIELPAGYSAANIDVSSIRLQGVVPAESKPYAIGDYNSNGVPDLMVKFKRSDVLNVLADGDRVPVHVTGKIGSIVFDGVDIISVTRH